MKRFIWYDKNGHDIPYFEGLFILSLKAVYPSAIEYLNPLSWRSSFYRTLGSALLCSFASAVIPSRHVPVFPAFSALVNGKQPNGGDVCFK